MDLRWNCTKRDTDALKDALKKSFVSILHVDLRRFQPSYAGFGRQLLSMSICYTGFGSQLSTSDGYIALHRLLEPANLKSIHLVLPNGLLRLSNFTPKRPPHLHRLTFEIVIGSLESTDVRTLAEIYNNGSSRITLYLSDSTEDKGDQALSEALKTNSTLTALNLSHIKIGESEAQALSEALKTNSTLTTLDLSRSRIRDEEVQALSEALKINATLTNLNLNFIIIGKKGILALSEALMINSTLTTLNLRSCYIGEEGAHALSEALKTNLTLTTLDLYRNPIGGNGAKALSAAFKTNSTLVTLNLHDCSIGENGAQALSEGKDSRSIRL